MKGMRLSRSSVSCMAVASCRTEDSCAQNSVRVAKAWQSFIYREVVDESLNHYTQGRASAVELARGRQIRFARICSTNLAAVLALEIEHMTSVPFSR